MIAITHLKKVKKKQNVKLIEKKKINNLNKYITNHLYDIISLMIFNLSNKYSNFSSNSDLF
jgi:hypothetical protein